MNKEENVFVKPDEQNQAAWVLPWKEKISIKWNNSSSIPTR